LSHEHSGRTTRTFACQYLHWLHRYSRGQSITLLWDVFAAHSCVEAKKLAPELKIEIEFIPPGMTRDYQPLGRRVFGHLKVRARHRFVRFCIDQNGDRTIQNSVAMMVDDTSAQSSPGPLQSNSICHLLSTISRQNSVNRPVPRPYQFPHYHAIFSPVRLVGLRLLSARRI
jgi:hypothetical protein